MLKTLNKGRNDAVFSVKWELCHVLVSAGFTALGGKKETGYFSRVCCRDVMRGSGFK